jgi:hypothetical protein
LKVKELVRWDLEDNPYADELLKSPANLGLAKQIVKSAVQWESGDPEKIKRKMHESNRKKWNVFVPDSFAADAWKRLRPQDSGNVVVLPKYPDETSIMKLSQSLEKALKNSGQPCVIVTGPRAASSEEVFSIVRNYLTSDQALPAIDPSRVVWAHQGSRPLNIGVRPSKNTVGMISLHSSSTQAIGALVDLLEPTLGEHIHGSQFR